jgi:hypothetical protein
MATHGEIRWPAAGDSRWPHTGRFPRLRSLLEPS